MGRRIGSLGSDHLVTEAEFSDMFLFKYILVDDLAYRDIMKVFTFCRLRVKSLADIKKPNIYRHRFAGTNSRRTIDEILPIGMQVSGDILCDFEDTNHCKMSDYPGWCLTFVYNTHAGGSSAKIPLRNISHVFNFDRYVGSELFNTYISGSFESFVYEKQPDKTDRDANKG